MIIVYFVLGLVIGSFLNVCIDRLPRKESILSPPSRCTACGQQLRPLDLIPVVSFLLLRGRCRYCTAPLPWRLPVVELGTGLLFAFLWYHLGPSVQLLLLTAYASILVVVLFIDLEHRLVLNVVSYPAIVLALVAAPFTPNQTILRLLLGGLVGFVIFLIIALVYPGGMGMGDVKLATFLGLVTGFPQVIIFIYISFIIGGLVALGLLVTRLKKRKDPIPFAPFLVIGGFTTMVYGQEILRWFLAR
ncbi:MAG: prepilin peptidase [Chloroflexota bacterium]